MSTDSSTSLTNETKDPSQSAQDPPPPTSDSNPLNSHNGDQHTENPLNKPRPMRKYTRNQLVALSNSPLVQPPPNMPELKVWFGSENENLMKKEDSPTPNTARDRRFRRDADDGDTPSRPSFRSTLSQPSQMGNFKHQSLRPNDRDRDRDRDRDGDRERERDIRDKEGHERLRHLSDKFDRDRLALPLSNTRNLKERDTAPHLTAAGRAAQPLSSNAASRRAETREATKKKVGEASEDWRRGAEPPRTTREERTDANKRDDRERARSRPRDSSGTKRESSASRRDRDEPREKARGDREDSRRDRDRDRDLETDDDPRRWRDDGKREERLASRRERGRDKPAQDGNWDSSADKRWLPGEERDIRYKRTARDRKPGNPSGDDLREKEDRRDKDREKEKEPAWMDTYVPETTTGILGGQNLTGELDGIQAWKKELKEKEKEAKEKDAPKDSESVTLQPSVPDKPPMDEIQMFKMMMKQEEMKRNELGSDSGPRGEQLPSDGSGQVMHKQKPNEHDSTADSLVRNPEIVQSQVSQATINLSALSLDPLSRKDPLIPIPNKALADQDRILLSTKNSQTSLLPESSLSSGLSGKPADSTTSGSFQPPPGSRLLAFARPTPPANPLNPPNNVQVSNGLQSVSQEAMQGLSRVEPPRPQPGFSPFEEQNRQTFGFEEQKDMSQAHYLNSLPRGMVDQSFSSNVQAPEANYNGTAVGKGSRFAKFFDGKARDNAPPSAKQQAIGGFTSPSPNHNHRHEHTSLVTGTSGDQRAMDDLFAMLNSSAQRGNVGHQSNNNALPNNAGAFGNPGPSLHALQQQHLLQQSQLHHSNRLEPLYDSRGDDRSFVPDGMVPGLRTAPPPPPRSREGHFLDQPEDPLYNFQRLSQMNAQGRNLEPLFSGPTPIYAQQQQGGRPNIGVNLQSGQPQYRGGPSPNLNQGGLMSNNLQQRLPPGLANLGARPPHEPNQFIGLPGLASNVPHGGLHGNGLLPPQQQLPFNNFNGNNNVGFNNGPQIRGPIPGQHLHNNALQQQHSLPLGNLGHPNLDPRLSNHHQLMGLGGSGVSGNRLNNSGFLQQGQAVPPHLGIRPQQQQPQQQHLPPHMLPQLMPPHLQQQGHPVSNNQPNHDLIALLMGGQHRE
ncbi:hypothetical protein CPC08DRAFT_812711 [Agrocybe pediades]|nr:hypothetical protein CPC08DRAFT_812711 [Agrocybe pediades]